MRERPVHARRTSAGERKHRVHTRVHAVEFCSICLFFLQACDMSDDLSSAFAERMAVHAKMLCGGIMQRLLCACQSNVSLC